jgi:hypothetical protein
MARDDYSGLLDDAAVTLTGLAPGAEDRARTMLRRLGNKHGCTGLGCREPGHQQDVEAVAEAWRAAGLAHDPGTAHGAYPGYGPRKGKTRR